MIPRIATRSTMPIGASSLARRRVIAPPPRIWSRHNSSSSQTKEPSFNTNFYRTFGRPMAKVFLLAIFTYQFTYYWWVRLEHNEIKSEMQATISDLEARIEQLEKARKR